MMIMVSLSKTKSFLLSQTTSEALVYGNSVESGGYFLAPKNQPTRKIDTIHSDHYLFWKLQSSSIVYGRLLRLLLDET